jgi:V8-like Glu-specific endopeptidase
MRVSLNTVYLLPRRHLTRASNLGPVVMAVGVAALVVSGCGTSVHSSTPIPASGEASASSTVALAHPAASSAKPATTTTTTTATATATTATATAPSSSGSAAPTAKPPAGVPSVGPLFVDGLGSEHNCTASVLDSRAGNLIMTAAHCISGDGAGAVFAPGYANGDTPYGTWVVTSTYAPTKWLDSADPAYDFAILAVTPAATNPTNGSVQAVVGGDRLGAAPAAGEQITVAGYVAGTDDEPVICSTTTHLTGAFPTFDCAGYAGGTSGSPWIADLDPSTGHGVLVALIGGLNQGGCRPDTSYSPPFTAAVQQLLQRATDAGEGDDLQPAPSDGC